MTQRHNDPTVKGLLLALLAIFSFSNINAGKGVHYIKNFDENRLSHSGQTWMISMFDDDWIYFATKEGVMQWDGWKWRNFPMNTGTDARAVLAAKDEGRIYVSGINEFGYLAPAENGQMEYTCMSDSFGIKHKNIGNIWNIHKKDDTLIFQGDNRILTIQNGQPSIIEAGSKIDCSAMINGVVYIATETGLKLIVNGQLLTANGTGGIHGIRIRSILPYQKGMLLVTASSGIYSYDGTAIRQLPLPNGNRFVTDVIFCAAIHDDTLALGTVSNGIVIIDLNSGNVQYYNEHNGLQNNTVLSLEFDSSGVLWVGLDEGISKIYLNQPVTAIPGWRLPIGAAYSVMTDRNRMLIGTNRGLFSADNSKSDLTDKSSYRLVGDLVGQVWNIQKIGNDIFCLHDNGTFIIKDNKAANTGITIGSWLICQADGNVSKCWVGTYDGLYMISNDNGSWSVTGRVEGIDESMYNFVEHPCGDILFIKRDDGIVRTSVDRNTLKAENTRTYKEMKNHGHMNLSKIDDRIYASIAGEIYLLDDKNDKFVRDSTFNNIIGGNIDRVTLQQTDRNIYALTPYDMIRIPKNDITKARRLPLYPDNAKPMSESFLLNILGDTTVLFPNQTGVSIFNFSDKQPLSTPPHSKPLIINELRLAKNNDSIIYTANFLRKKIVTEIPFTENSVRINFGVENHLENGVCGYSYRLNGEAWSETSMLTSKEYTNLSPGHYRFEVREMTCDGSVISDSIEFIILSPWYLKWPAIAAYILIAAIASYIAIRTAKKRMVKKERGIIREKEEKITELKNEQIEIELRHKSQEIVNLLTSVSRNNETLSDIKQSLQQLSASVQGNNEARRQIQAIQSRITTNMQSDIVFQRIEKEFDLIHNNFIKKLKTLYPDLSSGELLMCAYILMNMSSKEIAPLLNISVRGVETMRYRIRKKFGLDRESGLYEFLSDLK